ncbi:MAG: IMP cyclohydrolase [Ruminiclostridium sp.]|nr:IMP cyclohydrolase [Ruminiclostridium sp.]
MNIYETLDLAALLAQNPYPGRGILLGKTDDSTKSVVAYFIMGRSENSRNRVFIGEPDGIRTEAHDPAKLADPSLIIYHPVRQLGRSLIVTNGDQTDTIRDYLEKGMTLEQALRTREFEPDGPNWTPRISGLLAPDGSYKLSILKSADADGSACARYFYEYPGLAGVGHFIHTYVTDGDPIPTFQGEPERVTITGTMEEFTNMVWSNLNEANKISLYVRFTDLATGEYEETVINKNQ